MDSLGGCPARTRQAHPTHPDEPAPVPAPPPCAKVGRTEAREEGGRNEESDEIGRAKTQRTVKVAVWVDRNRVFATLSCCETRLSSARHLRRGRAWASSQLFSHCVPIYLFFCVLISANFAWSKGWLVFLAMLERWGVGQLETSVWDTRARVCVCVSRGRCWKRTGLREESGCLPRRVGAGFPGS